MTEFINDNTTIIITCEFCKDTYPLGEHLHHHTVFKGVVQHFIRCPHCKTATHAWFDTPSIRTLRNQLNNAQRAVEAAKSKGQAALMLQWNEYQRVKALFQENYHREQEHYRGELIKKHEEAKSVVSDSSS